MQGKRILGWLLIAPLALNILAELFLLALIALQGDNNDERWISFTFIAILLVVTAPLAYVGRQVLQGGFPKKLEPTDHVEGVTEPETTAFSGWLLAGVSVVVMIAAVLELLLGLTGVVILGRLLAAVGIWILFAFPLVEGIRRIRIDRSAHEDGMEQLTR